MNYRLILVRLFGMALLWMWLWPWPAEAAARDDRSDLLATSSFEFLIDDDVAPYGSVHPGDTIHYTLLLTNTGDLPLANAEIAVLVPPYSAVPAPGAAWLCAPADHQPEKIICRTTVVSLAVGAADTIDFALQLLLDFPPNQQTLILEANVTADDVVCGDCGYAWCETPIVWGGGEGAHRLHLPLVAAPN